jgi:hypothetical protein
LEYEISFVPKELYKREPDELCWMRWVATLIGGEWWLHNSHSERIDNQIEK